MNFLEGLAVSALCFRFQGRVGGGGGGGGGGRGAGQWMHTEVLYFIAAAAP